MKGKLKYIFILFLSGVLFYSCSEIKNDIPTPSNISVHGENFNKVNSPEFHGAVIRKSNWNLKACQECHAADYSGGTTGASCLKCHTGSKGPEACNTCHGDFGNPARIAPPRDSYGNTETTARGVGAHTMHLYENLITENLHCSECHNVPHSIYDEGHIISPLPAPVVLGNLSKRNGAMDASYNPDDQTCSNTYCHGNFTFYKDSTANQYMYVADKIVGNNVSVKWTQDYPDGVCGSCHGLPPTGHYGPLEITSCYRCHGAVVDSLGNIIDKTKHIDGKINYNSPIL
jgi:predicted CxxxxCH...CXXCH cytochrome family protein